MRPPLFGIFPVPALDNVDEVIAQIKLADSEGLDLVGIQDHPYQKRFVDTMTLIGHAAAMTDDITFFPDVASLPLRPPAVLATQAATIDQLSGGRFELGLGAGAFWAAISAMGGPNRSPGEALRALEEAIDVIRLMWSSERSVRYSGEHYQLSGVKPGPVPAHDMGIWLGVYGPRAIDLLGRKADGWVPSIPSMPVESLLEKHEAIDAAAVAAGRDPNEIVRIANVNGLITDGETDGFLRGPVDQWVDELAELNSTHRLDGFVLWSEGDAISQTDRFVEVARLTRKALGY